MMYATPLPNSATGHEPRFCFCGGESPRPTDNEEA
jgi:hypothetical protein